MENQFKDQQKFTERVIGSKFPLTKEERTQWTKEYLLCIVAECMEVLEQMDWKHHKSEGKQIDLDNLGIEIIDIQKFIWGLSKIWDIDYDKFIDLYDLKTIEVESLWLQNHEIPKLSKQKDVCIIDIDGILNDYPYCFYNWVRDTRGEEVKDYINHPINYEKNKHYYRSSGAKQSIPIREDSKNALIELKNKGYTIVLLTNRPYRRYRRIYGDTIKWLNKNEIPYDYIFWTSDKKILLAAEKLREIKFIVDDNLDICKDFAVLDIKTYYMGNADKVPQNITKINSLFDTEELK